VYVRVAQKLTMPPFSATVCSVFKTVELKAITKTQDPTWDGINLTIWSSCEASIGILIASLPPLRKAFDHLFQSILPTALQSSNGRTTHYDYGKSSHGDIHMSTFRNSKAYRSRLPGESVLDNDSDSDRAILKDEENMGAGITKTTQVTVLEEIRRASSKGPDFLHKQSLDWQVSGSATRSGHHAA
jgi:hypothetical protein